MTRACCSGVIDAPSDATDPSAVGLGRGCVSAAPHEAHEPGSPFSCTSREALISHGMMRAAMPMKKSASPP
jgi:hypothetical protein